MPFIWLPAAAAIIVVLEARDVERLWREPTLKHAVMVLESDDWGAGPLEQAAALEAIAAVLRRFRDVSGRPPVLSVAVVLAVPDGKAISAAADVYRNICLDHPALAPVLDALKRGEAEDVFSLQLHGLEHYWPPSLMASDDPQVHAWLREHSPVYTERLPPHLQSRWIAATNLPSSPLPDAEVQAAVACEIETFARVFSRPPAVVVPPTFVWTPVVERAWAANGVECVTTPGRRYTQLAADGAYVDDGQRFANGDRSARSPSFDMTTSRRLAAVMPSMHWAPFGVRFQRGVRAYSRITASISAPNRKRENTACRSWSDSSRVRWLQARE